jgi:outer membrane protein assembly factor BamB
MKMKDTLFRRLVFWLKFALIGLFIGILTISLTPVKQSIASLLSTNSSYLPIIEKANSYDWLQFNGDASHSGSNSLENHISVDNVGQLQLLFQVALPGVADGSPTYLSNVNTPSGLREVIYVTTRTGYIAALDAHTGALLWSKQYGATGCLINNNQARNESCYTTSSPAIDPNRKYVYSYGLDGYVHKYAVGDGAEVLTGGWPELTTLKGYDEKGSSALSLATTPSGQSYLYVVHAGYPGDQGDYQGHITTINLADGTQKVFNTLCSDQTVHFVDSRVSTGPDCYPDTTAAIWARPGVMYDPYHNRILMTTGNGTFQPASFMWGDTIFSLNPDGTGSGGSPMDSYTPDNYQEIQNLDLDLGSTAPAILPPASGNYPHLAVQGGKDALLRIINLDQLSGQSGVGHTGGELFSMPVPMGGQIHTQPAVWVNPTDHSTWIFVSNFSGSAGLQLTINQAGDPTLSLKWMGGWGSSPLVANGVVYIASHNLISALNAINGSLLWSDNRIGQIHWESPIVVHGVLYITDQSGNLTAYTFP